MAGGLVDAIDLADRERHHLPAPRPAGQQIGMPAPQLVRARSGQQEALPPILNQPVHLVQQGRDLLHFVDDHERVAGVGDALPQQCGAGRILTVDVGLEQVDQEGVRKEGAASSRH